MTPFLYSYCAEAKQKKWAEVAKTYPLWMAQYASGYTPVRGYLSDPPGEKDVGCWGKNIAIRQYTSQGYLDGYSGNLDLNLAYIGKAEWDKLCGKTGTETPEEPKAPLPIDEVARQVLAGEWGNGEERKAKLTAAGYSYVAVQKRVNEILAEDDIESLARAVIRGEYGNGITRRVKLGSKYAAVQKRVNEILGV